MNFLTRFLKVFIVALVFSALGALVFYWVVISGSKLRPDVSREEFMSTIGFGVGIWLGFIIVLSIFLAFMGMKRTIPVQVSDRDVFLQRVTHAITSLRYRPYQQTENSLTFKPPIIGGLLAEKISVQLEPNSATITAPRGLLEKIKQRL